MPQEPILSISVEALAEAPRPVAVAGQIVGTSSINSGVEVGRRLRLDSSPPSKPFRIYNRVVVPTHPVPPDLQAALDLARNTNHARIVRARPLPTGILGVIRIAAGDMFALGRAVRACGKDPMFVHAAAMFYLQEALWGAASDHYRALGAKPESSAVELAEHARWLMKWLSPYLGRDDRQAVFADRVVEAWDALRTPERRAQYDRALFKDPEASLQRWRQAGWTLATLAIIGVAIVGGIAASGNFKSEFSPLFSGATDSDRSVLPVANLNTSAR